MIGTRPLVSFVVLNYDNGRYLSDCLNSILTQAGDYDVEIILVDDASTDHSAVVARAYNDPRLHLIQHLTNRGHLATVQEGLRAAQGEYIARIDSDDRYHPHFLEDVVPILRKYPEVGLVYGDAAIIDEQGCLNADRSDVVHGHCDHKGNEFVCLLESNFICAPTVIARREGWLQALPLPEGLAFHDWYFTIMMARVWEFYYVDRVLADYRVHTSNMHTRIARDGSEEKSVFWILDHIYRESENSLALDDHKQHVRSRVYGAHYLDIADKYFWFRMSKEAQRCYLRAIRYRPELILRLDVMRRLGAAVVGQELYESCKTLVKSNLHKVEHLLSK